ncbi:MAG: hypothetical protein IV101_01280 [Dechloromonas sp.]|nr:hypothetical protein [Dechloromonas sp.]
MAGRIPASGQAKIIDWLFPLNPTVNREKGPKMKWLAKVCAFVRGHRNKSLMKQ